MTNTKQFILVTMLVLVGLEGATFAEDKERVIHFPEDRSMGLVHVGELRTLDPHWWQGWDAVYS